MKKIKKPFCVTFAGPVGCSKTPITQYLSGKLNLPVFNNDAIRSEVLEDFGQLDQDIYIRRRNTRLKNILRHKISFIYDASVDRQWETLKSWLQKSNYSYFIISIDLNKKILSRLYNLKGFKESQRRLEQLLSEHRAFVLKYGHEIGLHINDRNFRDRLNLSYKALKRGAQSIV